MVPCRSAARLLLFCVAPPIGAPRKAAQRGDRVKPAERFMRKRADDAEARLAAIVESTDDAIVSTSLDDTITSWNRAAERMFGYSAADAIGQPIALIVPADGASEEREVLERMRAGQAIEARDTVRRRKDG